jgi:geranylgeranyl pyrophosphate synthase
MDDDDLRRGRPTCHKVFGEATAILAGDALLAMAFELLAADAERELAPLLVVELARATGPAGMVGGQQLDIESENRVLQLEQLQQLHRLKTGALLTAACRLGAISAGAEPSAIERVTLFGKRLGLAFQIVDDLLDVVASEKQLGKRTGKDAARGKNTYPSLLGVAAARREAKAQLRAALDALAPLGKLAEPLRVLARFVVERRR